MNGYGIELTPPQAQSDARVFIESRMRLELVPMLHGIRLFTAHPGSGLRRFSERGGRQDRPPYWAWPWAGGIALARYFFDRGESVSGKRVLDLGAGSGIVGIAAARAGASAVTAAEIDPAGIVALGLNAAANGVDIAVMSEDLTGGPAPAADVVAVGDLFYDADLSEQVTAYLDRCLAAGITVLVGDPGRAHLPRSRLHLLAEYLVADVGEERGSSATPGMVFQLEPAERRA